MRQRNQEADNRKTITGRAQSEMGGYEREVSCFRGERKSIGVMRMRSIWRGWRFNQKRHSNLIILSSCLRKIMVSEKEDPEGHFSKTGFRGARYQVLVEVAGTLLLL